jgi:hypothetical protein
MRLRWRRKKRFAWRPVLPPRTVLLRVGLLLAAAAVLSTIVLAYNLYPGRVALRAGDISTAEILAPRTAKYEDSAATEDLRHVAKQRVGRQYVSLDNAVAGAEDAVERAFAPLVRAGPKPTLARLQPSFPGASPEAVNWGLDQNPDHIAQLQDQTVAVVRSVMNDEIRDDEQDLARARRQAGTRVARLPVAAEARSLVAAAAAAAIRPNRRYSEEKTRKARDEASRHIQPVERTIAAGGPILYKGETVTERHLAALRAVGLTSPRLDYRRVVPIVSIVLIGLLFLAVFTRHYATPVHDQPKLLLLFYLLVAASLFATNLFVLYLPHLSMLFVAATTLAIGILLSPTLALAAALFQAALIGVMAGVQPAVSLLALGSGCAAFACLRHIWPPSELVKASAVIGGTNLLLVSAAGLLAGADPADIAREASLGLFYGGVAAALGVGTIFVLQRPFDITTHLRLVELSNPNEPLLRRLQGEAPGTYHASTIVAGLADAAAQAIGADPLVARVGALYHDIGKLRRPGFFVENQALLGLGNIHDQLAPSLSSLVVKAHVKDGVELARRYRLPSVIRDIIAQHHGAGLVVYFYHQAVAQQAEVTEEHYRYDGPKPRSREAAIVMLADVAQATVKSLTDPTLAKVEAVVQELVWDKLQDRQLDECELTFADLSALAQAFVRTLHGIMFHTRIEYPSAGAPRKERPHAGIDQRPPEPPDQPAEVASRNAGGA